MKIADKGPVDVGLSQLVKDSRAVSSARENSDKKSVERTGEAAQVSISPEARKLQQVSALAEQADELRTAKLNRVKEQIDQGTYQASSNDIAKGIARSEISRLLGNG
jgi:flagellar biosynthesis anti-sigma factor FlgM